MDFASVRKVIEKRGRDSTEPPTPAFQGCALGVQIGAQLLSIPAHRAENTGQITK
jgi:hypothetical protein